MSRKLRFAAVTWLSGVAVVWLLPKLGGHVSTEQAVSLVKTLVWGVSFPCFLAYLVNDAIVVWWKGKTNQLGR